MITQNFRTSEDSKSIKLVQCFINLNIFRKKDFFKVSELLRSSAKVNAIFILNMTNELCNTSYIKLHQAFNELSWI